MAVKHSRVSPVLEYQPLHITATGTIVPVGLGVSTTSSTTITAGNGVVVTPASMANIYAGMILNIANGTGSAEDITVSSITSTTFTANFVNNHSGAYTIISRRGIDLGKIVVNTSTTSAASLTLYNGHPAILPDAGVAFAVIDLNSLPRAAHFDYECSCNKGLFYTLTGTPGDYTLMYLDHAN